MDWLSISLESSSLAKVPMWILVTQVYWKDLLQSRKYGRRLVAALCTHLQMVCLQLQQGYNNADQMHRPMKTQTEIFYFPL
jgi:hypothetical protein